MCPQTAIKRVSCNPVFQQHYRHIKRTNVMAYEINVNSTILQQPPPPPPPPLTKVYTVLVPILAKKGYFAMGGANLWNQEKVVLFQTWVSEILKKAKFCMYFFPFIFFIWSKPGAKHRSGPWWRLPLPAIRAAANPFKKWFSSSCFLNIIWTWFLNMQGYIIMYVLLTTCVMLW